MSKNIRIGDRVRFLNDVGGGIVCRIEGKVVYVEDSDGFEIPTKASECVVVGQGDSYVPAYKLPKLSHSQSESNTHLVEQSAVTLDPTDGIYHPKRISSAPTARHDKVNAAMAFLPFNEKRLGTEPFELYLINDSNYTLFFTLASRDGDDLSLRAVGRLEPNTKAFVEEIAPSAINEMAHLQIQMIAYKDSARFVGKATYSIDLKVEVVRFFKLHSYRDNDFFDEKAIVYPLVQDDRVVRPLEVSAQEMMAVMLNKQRPEQPQAQRATSVAKPQDEIIEIDLHASELLETTAGMSATDILNYQMDTFRRILGDYAKEKGRRIVFIHGKGEGVLRRAIEMELKRKYPKYEARDASFREYGFGATMVIIH